MKVQFLEAAEYELKEAINYYNEQSAGLGYEFALEIQYTLERITNYPEAWVFIHSNYRKCVADRFPYNVIYRIEDDCLYIVAVAHCKRKPLYWKKRFNR